MSVAGQKDTHYNCRHVISKLLYVPGLSESTSSHPGHTKIVIHSDILTRHFATGSLFTQNTDVH